VRLSRYVFAFLALATSLLSPTRATADDRGDRGIIACSPNGVYEVQAKSPDNEAWDFRANFVYTCVDKKTRKTLWVRKQPMGKPVRLSKDSPKTDSFPKEGSPLDILVSDHGWTVIRTEWDDLIAVANSGIDRWQIDLLTDALTSDERKRFVREAVDAGPMWDGWSLWYFLDVGKQQLFVIRPWWGRRIVIDIENGKFVAENKAISAAIADYERAYVLKSLARGIETRKQWENEEGDMSSFPIDAPYLAGALHVREAIPLLQKLQDSTYRGCSASGGLSWRETFRNEVDPHSYETFNMRQMVQLSLRRLGETPKPFPVNQFDVRQEVWNGFHAYVPKPLSVPRQENSDKIHKGMKAEQVLDLLDGPDFVGYDTWEYDMDAVPPFTLVIKWDARKVIGVEKKIPPLWKQGLLRDDPMRH
jgi:hypothetical protein